MSELSDAVEKLLKALNTLISSPPSVIALVMVIISSMLVWKLTAFVLRYVLTRSAKFGQLEAIAVGYKVLHEGITPERALKEICRELED